MGKNKVPSDQSSRVTRAVTPRQSLGVAVTLNSATGARVAQVGISVGPAASNNRLKPAARGRSRADARLQTRAAA
jgi:hypothetical protein